MSEEKAPNLTPDDLCLPWTIAPCECGRLRASGVNCGKYYIESGVANLANVNMDKEQAAFIVHACNHYDHLVQVLRRIHRDCREVAEGRRQVTADFWHAILDCAKRSLIEAEGTL